MPKFFISREDIQGSYIVIRHDVHHIVHVLRKQTGDTLTVCDGLSMDYDCRILQIDSGEESIICQITDSRRSDAEPNVAVTLYQSLPKGDKMEYVIQKSVELGVSRIVPYYSERSLIHLDSKKAAQKVTRWNAIAEAAAKQSGRGLIPEVDFVHTFKQAAEEAAKYDLAILFYEKAQDISLKQVLTEAQTRLGRKPETVGIWIGPEGGFAPEEAKKLEEAGCATAGLGSRILRCETAGMMACAMILYHYDAM